MPGAPTPDGAAEDEPSAWSSSATTTATASATWLPMISRVPEGVGTRASPTIRSDALEGDAEDLGAPDVDPVGDAGTAGGAGALAHEVDSTRAFSSRMAMAMIRLVARILMKPGMGTRSSASRW